MRQNKLKCCKSNQNKSLDIKAVIESRVCPRMEELFQYDSEHFDNVIKLRTQRDNENDTQKRRRLDKEAQEALKLATDIPLEIAKLCLELGDFATEVFDHGFKSARGDSGVALSSAISGVASCLFIIDLNLTTLPYDQWMIETMRQRDVVKIKYETLRLLEKERHSSLEKEAKRNFLYRQMIADFSHGDLGESISSFADIEQLTRRLQNVLWVYRDKVWKKDLPEMPIQILNPETVLKKVLGYDYQLSDSLGIFELEGERFQTAGIIDKGQKVVQISRKLPKEVQNFTAAHELGHAILHNQAVLHRDRPIDGTSTIAKSLDEMQADKFAVYFLLPSMLVRNAFQHVFGVPKFSMNENSVFALGNRSVQAFRKKCGDSRGLARELASAEFYGNKPFVSLAKAFNVSVETMAIRLEELNLVEF